MYDCGLITTISGIACALINSCSKDDLAIMSVIFTQLGDTLATYLTQKEICESRQAIKDIEKTPEKASSRNNNETENVEPGADIITNI